MSRVRIPIADYEALTARQKESFDVCGEQVRLGEPTFFDGDAPVERAEDGTLVGIVTHVVFDDHRVTIEHEATAEAITEDPLKVPARTAKEDPDPVKIRQAYRTEIDVKVAEKTVVRETR